MSTLVLMLKTVAGFLMVAALTGCADDVDTGAAGAVQLADFLGAWSLTFDASPCADEVTVAFTLALVDDVPELDWYKPVDAAGFVLEDGTLRLHVDEAGAGDVRVWLTADGADVQWSNYVTSGPCAMDAPVSAHVERR